MRRSLFILGVAALTTFIPTFLAGRAFAGSNGVGTGGLQGFPAVPATDLSDGGTIGGCVINNSSIQCASATLGFVDAGTTCMGGNTTCFTPNTTVSSFTGLIYSGNIGTSGAGDVACTTQSGSACNISARNSSGTAAASMTSAGVVTAGQFTNSTTDGCYYGTTTTHGYCVATSSQSLVFRNNSAEQARISGVTGDFENYSSGRNVRTSGVALGSKTPFAVDTAPTLTGGCTSPAVSWSNGTALFQFDVGTTCAGISTITVTLPAKTNGWGCDCFDTGAATNVRQSGGTTTTAVITNYGTSVATPAAWTDGADIRCKCSGG